MGLGEPGPARGRGPGGHRKEAFMPAARDGEHRGPRPGRRHDGARAGAPKELPFVAFLVYNLGQK